jgi:hypothetical protein
MTYEKKEIICNWFYYNSNEFKILAASGIICEHVDIIFVKRGVDISYKSLDHENKKYKERIKSHGSDRRNITNDHDLYKGIVEHFSNLKVMYMSLEFLSIFYEYHLLSECKILICQHGAALGNMVFMKKGATVVEIIQQKFIDQQENWFLYYGKEFKLKHYQYVVDEKEDFFDVNVNKFCKYLTKNNIE